MPHKVALRPAAEGSASVIERASAPTTPDGTTITVQMLRSVTGYGDKNAIVTLVQTPAVDNLIVGGYMAVYTGPAFSFTTRKAKTIATLGASIMFNGQVPDQADPTTSNGLASITPYSIIQHAMGKLDGKFAYAGSYATGGFTTQNVIDTWLPTCLANKPDVVLTGDSPINDINVAALTAPQIAAKMVTLLQSLISAGIVPVVINSKPYDAFTAPQRVTQRLYNKWLARYCEANGIAHVDAFSVFADKTNMVNGGANNAPLLCYDTVHPNNVGARLLGYKVGEAIAKLPICANLPSFRHGAEDDSTAIFTLTGSMTAGGASLPGATFLPLANNDARPVTITATVGQPTVTAAAGTFNVARDVGREIVHPAFASGTKILSVQSATAATMDHNAIAAGAAAGTVSAYNGERRGAEVGWVSSGAGTNLLVWAIAGSLIAGHRIQFSAYVDWSPGNGEVMSLFMFDAVNNLNICGLSGWDQPYVGWVRFEFVLPAGITPNANSVDIYLETSAAAAVNAGGTLSISQIIVDDLTAQGMS